MSLKISLDFFVIQIPIESEIDHFKKMIKSYRQLNKETHISEELEVKINDVFNNLLLEKQNALALFKIVAKNTFCLSRKMLFKIYQNIIEEHPILLEYVYPIKSDELTLSFKAVDILIDLYIDFYTLAKNSIKCIEISYLKDILLRFYKDDCHFLGLIVYRQNHEHMTPIYLEKDEEGMLVVITDSKGLKDYAFEYGLEIQKFFENYEDVSIFMYDKMRQKDSSSCPIFSLIDLKNCLECASANRKIRQFLKVSKQEIQSEITFPKLIRFSILPPEMMKTTQSLQSIDKFRSETPNIFKHLESPRILRTLPDHEENHVVRNVEDMVQKVECSTFYSCENIKVNKYIEEKKFLSILHVIETVLKTVSVASAVF